MNHDEDNLEGSDAEALRLENDILKLKLQAELGAHFGTVSDGPIPPEIEQQFLQQIMAFHKHRAEHPPVSVREHLGNPGWRLSAEIPEGELEAAWGAALSLLEEKHLRVDFLAEYPLAQRYDFIAGELMDVEIDMPMLTGGQEAGNGDEEGTIGPGTLCFIYEEFHPNHDLDMRARTDDFLRSFFTGTFDADHDLAQQLFTPGGKVISRDEAQALLDRFHGIFDSVKKGEWRIKEVSAQTDEEMSSGDAPRLGHTEGLVRYTAVAHDGTAQEIVGPFKLYMECAHGWWQVMHFYVHGFSWG